MEQINFYVDPKDNTFYYVGEVFCSFCKNEIEGRFILNSQWSSKRYATHKIVCLKCASKLPQINEVDERYLVELVNELKKGLVPKILTPPQISASSGLNVFQSAKSNGEAEIIDNTKLSYKENCTFDISTKERREKIGISEFQSEEIKNKIEERLKENKIGSIVNDIDKLFDEIKESKPLLTERKRRFLEFEEEE